MGCGACALGGISNSSRSLHQRLLEKLSKVRQKNLSSELRAFIALDEIKLIENSIQPVHQNLRLEELHRLQAGEQFLLSNERRVVWKLAIFQKHNTGEIPQYVENPTPKSQEVKNKFYQISLDVKRTFPKAQKLNKQHLTNVLQNYTLCFQGVGYTQGMNFFAGFFLLCGYSQKQTFEILVRLSFSKYFVLIRNFSEGFKNANCCIKIMEDIMSNCVTNGLKQILQKIKSLGMDLFLFVFSWFLTYFLYNFNIRSSLLIWQYILLSPCQTDLEESEQEKEKVLFGCGFVNTINLALKILQSLSPQLIQCTQLGQIMGILRHDSIQQHMTEAITEQLINRCKSDPYITWKSFKLLCSSKDAELFGIISNLQTNPLSEDSNLFFSECRFAKRTESTTFQ